MDRSLFLFPLLLVLLTACTTTAVTLSPTAAGEPTATITLRPSPTPTATPQPSPTPTPFLTLDVPRPTALSALHPVTPSVSLWSPTGAAFTATVRATVLDEHDNPFWVGRLWPQGGGRYRARRPFQVPLFSSDGDWRLKVYVQSTLPVTGTTEVSFRPRSLRFRPLTGTLHAGTAISVPVAFAEVQAVGDRWAGGRVWRHDGGEVALWWAPGPTEPLLFNNAVVILEATHEAEQPPRVLRVEEGEWQGHPAFLFHERWPGAEGGPAEAWVIQGVDYWLYVLRVRAVGRREIPAVVRSVGETFTLR